MRLSPLIITVIIISGYLPVSAQSFDTLKAETEIRAGVARYEAAWNRHDPAGLADEYSDSATWVNWFGSVWKGKKEIESHYKQVHETYFKSTHYYTRAVEDFLFLKPDVAIVHVRTGLSGDTRFPDRTFEFRRTEVFALIDGHWKVVAGQNAKLDDAIR